MVGCRYLVGKVRLGLVRLGYLHSCDRFGSTCDANRTITITTKMAGRFCSINGAFVTFYLFILQLH